MLDWLVVNTIVSNGDTYNKNYFLHRGPAGGRWSVMPWDYDLSFGRNADPVLPFPQNILNDSFYYLNPPDLGVPHVLKDKTLQNPALMQTLPGAHGPCAGAGAGCRCHPMPPSAGSRRSGCSPGSRSSRRIIAGDLARERYRNGPAGRGGDA